MRRFLIAMLTAAISFTIVILGAGSGQSDTMIRGLDMLPHISAEEAASFPEPQGIVQLSLAGVMAPYDVGSNTYFIPQSAQSGNYEGVLSIDSMEGWQYFLFPGADGNKKEAIETSIGYTVYGVCSDQCVSSKVIFTSLPVLSIQTHSGKLPGEEDGLGRLTMFSAAGGDIRVDQTNIEINLRGNTSKRLPKKSYRVKIIGEDGEKRNLSISGLRSDDDWILNPLYADTSKIRERLGYDLWAQINSSGKAANSSRMAYAEVFINGSYWGLYGVQERIDRKQVDADKRSGVLYKVTANDRPSAAELLECESGEACRGIELEFSGAGIDHPWEPAAAYIAMLSGDETDGTARLSMDNVIDFGLWAMLTQAHDCHFKNQFIHCVYSGSAHTMYKIPWDLNNTFGDVWVNNAADTNYTDYRIGKLVMDSAFELLIKTGDTEILESIQARWADLRGSVLQEEMLLSQAQALHEALYPAIVRDSRRWPECGMGNGNASNIRDIEKFIRTMLPRMDEYIENLGNESTNGQEERYGEDMDRRG